jgi:hypothetical protein
VAKIVTAKEFSFREVRFKLLVPVSTLFVVILFVLQTVLGEECAKEAPMVVAQGANALNHQTRVEAALV